MPGRPRTKPWFAETGQASPERLSNLEEALARLAMSGAANRIRITKLDTEPGQQFSNVLVREGVDLIAHPQTRLADYPAHLRRSQIELKDGHVAFLIEVIDRHDLSDFYAEVNKVEAEGADAQLESQPPVQGQLGE